MNNSKLLIELVKELNVDLDETSLNLMYKLLDSGMPADSLIELLATVKDELNKS